MRIVFQDGQIAELTNVDKIVVYNPGEVEICKFAVSDYYIHDLENQLGIKEDSDEYPSSQTSGDGYVSKRNMAQESPQHAGQSGVCDLPIQPGEEEASRSDTPRDSGHYRFPVE